GKQDVKYLLTAIAASVATACVLVATGASSGPYPRSPDVPYVSRVKFQRFPLECEYGPDYTVKKDGTTVPVLDRPVVSCYRLHVGPVQSVTFDKRGIQSIRIPDRRIYWDRPGGKGARTPSAFEDTV